MKKTLVRPNGTTTCCKAYTSIDQDGQEYCKACYQAADGYIGSAVKAPVTVLRLPKQSKRNKKAEGK